MSDRYHYDSQGNYRGKTSSSPPGGNGLFFLAAFGALFFAVFWIWEKINNYAALSLPYKYIAVFYFVTIAVPLKFVGTIYSSVTAPGLTPWPNINLILGVALVVSYLASIFYALRFVSKKIEDGAGALAGIFILPAVFGLLWFVGAAILHWLFLRA